MKFVTGIFSTSTLLSAFLICAILLGSCNKNNAQSNSARTGQKNSKLTDRPVIEFRRTACFGTCPIYRAQIMADGKINYQGRKFVEKTGEFTAKITQEQVNDLLEEASRAGFWQADTLYTTGATDFPSRVLTIRSGGKEKTVRTESSEPDNIKYLMQMMDDVILQALRENAEPVKQ